jgi:glycosyltransferase involved in cell wall biosynthesis
MNKDTISVVIPNRGKTELLLRALNSCLTQTLLPKEIILIDDNVENAEKEKIKKIVKEFKTLLKSTKIRTSLILLDSKGSGTASARNIGISHSSGTYLAFLDADDYFLPDKIKIQLQAMKDVNADISHTNYLATTNGDSSRIVVTSVNQGLNQDKVISFRECWIAAPTVMIKKNVIKYELDIFPKNIMGSGEDLVAWARICQLSNKPLLHLPHALSVVEVNGNSSSKSKHNIKIAKAHLANYAKIHKIEKPRFYQFGGIKRRLMDFAPLSKTAKNTLKQWQQH